MSAVAVRVESPTVARVEFPTSRAAALRSELTYRDKRVEHEIARLKHSRWVKPEERAEKLAELDAKRKVCLLFEDDRGAWTHSGLARRCGEVVGAVPQVGVEYPTPAPGRLPWRTAPKYEDYPYQAGGVSAMLAARHCAVEFGTGLGKSWIIVRLLKALGLRAVVMAPSTSIARQLHADLVEAFGSAKVGLYGDGSHEYLKLITVAIGASLVRIDPASPAAARFRHAEVFVSDESHLNPADTLAKVCLDLMAAAPYRFFLSATQMRTDGLDLLLEGITGPVVYRKSVREGIAEGYLAALDFTVVETRSDSAFSHPDVNRMTQCHLFYNERVCRQAAELANAFADRGQQSLILVDELEQYARLQPLLRHASKFAHGGVTKENRRKLPEPFWKSDPVAFVGEFNRSEFPILVGTSCISTGTNVRANEATLNLQGGKSEIAVMQGPCGRSTRLHTFPDGRKKTSCAVIDFDVANVPDMHRHARDREAIYERVALVRRLELP